jgi:predicted dehydrogenase
VAAATLERSLVSRRIRGALDDNVTPEISGDDNLKTMALVDACYLSAKEHRAVELSEILKNGAA